MSLPDFDDYLRQQEQTTDSEETATPTFEPGELVAPADDTEGERGVCIVTETHPETTPANWPISGVPTAATLADFEENAEYADEPGVTQVVFISSLKGRTGVLWTDFCERVADDPAVTLADVAAFMNDSREEWGLTVTTYSYPSARLEVPTDAEIAHLTEEHGIDYAALRGDT